MINIDDITLKAIHDYKEYQINQNKTINDSYFIFITDKGNLYNSTNLISWLKTIYNHCPEDLPRLTNHNFRKTHASLLLQSGVSVKYIQKRLGHKDIKTTLNIYTHLTSDMESLNLQEFMDYLKF
ncbi:tyrosine-type recombinase/integrase [Ligilactobacillus sp. LYQ135]